MADLDITIKESINLNNTSYGSVKTKTYANITDVFKRVFTLPADTEVNLYTTDASQTQGNVFDKDSIQYVRITNVETVTALNLQITQGTTAGVVWIQIPAGDSFILGSHSSAMDANAGALALASISLGDITQVDASGNAASAQIELFVASTINAI